MGFKEPSCANDVQVFLTSLIRKLEEFDRDDPHGIVVIPRAEAEWMAKMARVVARRCEDCSLKPKQ